MLSRIDFLNVGIVCSQKYHDGHDVGTVLRVDESRQYESAPAGVVATEASVYNVAGSETTGLQ